MTDTLTSLLTHNASLSDDLDKGDLDNNDIVFNSNDLLISADKLFCSLKESVCSQTSEAGAAPLSPSVSSSASAASSERAATHTAIHSTTAKTATRTMSNPEAFVKPSDYQSAPMASELDSHLLSAVAPLGQRLKEAREQQGWPLEEAAEQLKMTASKLRDIEADEFANISAPTYVIGYIRTYARWLNLPPEQVESLVTVYRQQHMPEASPSEPLPKAKEPLESFRPPAWTASVLVSIVLLAVVVGGFLFWKQQQAVELSTFLGDKPLALLESSLQSSDVDTTPMVSSVVQEATASDATEQPVAESSVTQQPPMEARDLPQASQKLRTLESVEDVVPPIASLSVSEPAAPASEVVAPQSSPTESLSRAEAQPSPSLSTETDQMASSSQATAPTSAATSGTRHLQLNMVADSWMEIRDGHGHRRYTGVKKAGQELVLDNMVPPIALHLGNARGVFVTVDGKVFPIQPHAGRDSLRVTIPAAKL